MCHFDNYLDVKDFEPVLHDPLQPEPHARDHWEPGHLLLQLSLLDPDPEQVCQDLRLQPRLLQHSLRYIWLLVHLSCLAQEEGLPLVPGMFPSVKIHFI